MGQTAKGHKPEHPMQEYCTSTGASVNLRNLGQAFRNSFRTKKYFKKKQQKLGYLPVNKSGQQDPEELDDTKDPSAPASLPPPSLSPNLSAADSLAAGSHNGSLVPKTVQQPDESSPAKAQQQQRQHQPPPPPSIKGPSTKTTELHDTDNQDHDEHSLIARLCGRLKEASALEELSDTDTDSAGGGNSLPRVGGGGRRGELEKMIFRLEDENRRLTDEYEALRAKRIRQDSERGGGGGEEEARRLRQKSARMEARMKILEDHNRRLLEQLDRLRQLHATQQQQGGAEEGAASPPLRLMSPEHLPAGMGSSLAPGAPGQDEGTNNFGTLQSKSVVATMLSAEQPGGMNNGESYSFRFTMQTFRQLLFSCTGDDSLSRRHRDPPKAGVKGRSLLLRPSSATDDGTGSLDLSDQDAQRVDSD